jgi:uridine phosphorylase
MGIIDTFDNSTEEILKPSHMAKPVEGFPEIVIVTFGKKMLDILLNKNKAEIVSTMMAGMEIPIYKAEYKGKEVAFYLTVVGGAGTVGLLEEIIVKGGKKILLFGSSGSLGKNITDGHIIVPTFAYRDEGTSYHYVSAEIGDYIEINTANRLLKIFSDIGIPAIGGKTWTTDAIYRETYRNKELRKNDGCITVEMECASVMAMAKFRNIDIYQFLYTADNLDCKEWEPRLLGNMPQDIREKYAQIALEVSIRL